MGAHRLIDALFQTERKKKSVLVDVNGTLVNHTQVVKSYPVSQSSGCHLAGQRWEVTDNAFLDENAVCWGFDRTDERDRAACIRSKTNTVYATMSDLSFASPIGLEPESHNGQRSH